MKMNKKKKAAILAAAMSLGVGSQVSAMERVPIMWNGKQLFDVQYYDVGEVNDDVLSFFKMVSGSDSLVYNLMPDIKEGLNKAFYWWAEIIGPGSKNPQPAQYFVATFDAANAAALSFSGFNNKLQTKNPDVFAEIFQNGTVVDTFDNITDFNADIDTFLKDGFGFGLVYIGQNMGFNENDGNYGFVTTPYYALPVAQTMKQLDITPVMFHEIGHSLGISADVKYTDYALKYKDNTIKYIDSGASNPNNFTYYLYDQYGRKAEEGMLVLTNEMFNDETLRAQYLEATGTELTADKVFFMDEFHGTTGRQGQTYAYFSGKNVIEVLDGKTYIRGGDGAEISGIPINQWEDDPELSHVEIARCLMSHQYYRSYNNFTEMELAILQDVGYQIDRKNFYGRSIYNDNVTLTNEQGYSARENGQYVDGYNNATMGVGLHVFGSYNDITQKGNIFTNGYGATGIRVDGINNNVTVPSGTEIHSDGTLGTGVLVAYGKNQNITIDGTVTANGEGGDAVHFEFGANSIGGNTEYRGSYMRYKRKISNTGQMMDAKNYGFNEMTHYRDDYSITDLVNGDNNEKMASLTVNGKIEATGGGAAIYIAEESFVDKIDVNAGAKINGDIVSVWKQFDADAYGIYDTEQTITYQEKNSAGEIETKTSDVEPLYIQYKGGKYIYNEYIPDLVTNLNFNGDNSYSGNINGADNMKINFNAGKFNYGGAANVVSVNVANGAKLFGGNFTVNDMTANLAEGFTDDTTGKFYNHGTISGLTINGNLVSDGILSDEAGVITVNGAANVNGSTATTKNLLPNETKSILTATNGVTGDLKNSQTPTEISGLLSATGKVENNSVTVTTHAANNIGNLTDNESVAFLAANNMATALTDDDRKEQLVPLYEFDAVNAKIALSQIGNSDAVQMMSLAQKNSIVGKVISDRLTTAFSTETVNFNVGGNNFADGDSDVVMGVNADYPASVDNNFWIKFNKDWGKLNDGAKYHGSAISGGYDRAFGENWRGGLFFSYNNTGFGANYSNGEIKDKRGGIYLGYHNDVDNAFFYIDGGKVRNNLNRSISTLGLRTSANYDSNIFEIGGEYKRNLTPEKSSAISPFINLQYSRLKQHAYNETGAGIFNQHINSKSNGYFAGTLGVEFKRVLSKGNYAARVGIKHAFTGADPELNFSYEGDGYNYYTLKNNQDKTHFILTLSGENEFAHGWIFGGDLALQKGSHDRNFGASIMLRKVW